MSGDRRPRGERGRISVALRLVAASLLAVASLAAPSSAAPVAAADGVEVTAATTYTIQPEEARILVRVDAELKNVTPDEGRTRFFFTAYRLSLPAEAQRVRATQGERRLDVATTPSGDQLETRVEFGRRVFRNDVFRFRLQFVLPAGGPRSNDPVRVGRAYAAFYAYAYGEERADVRIDVPSGFAVRTEGQPLEQGTAEGLTTLRAAGISQPGEWWAWISAERPESLREVAFDVDIDGAPRAVRLQAWPEDEEWSRAVRERLGRGLPALRDLVGLEWPLERPLTIVERHSPLLGGYAGFYDLRADRIEITEQLDEHVTLHEAAHAWFNDSLFRERWINEGLADEYASLAVVSVGGAPTVPRPVDRDDEVAFPLNMWPEADRVAEPGTRQREGYGYDAAWGVFRMLHAEIGSVALRRVMVAADAREIPYLGRGDPERFGGIADWRVLLDLLEERAGSAQAADLFDRWVVDDAQRQELARRSEARDEYARFVAASAPWTPPYALRAAMAEWRFEDARQYVGEASRLIEQRDRIARQARALAITPTPTLQRTYESAGTDLAPALALAADQLATLETIERSTREVGAADLDAIERLGLMGRDPAAGLGEARAAFSRDDLPGARAAAASAVELVAQAGPAGTERAVMVAAGVIGLLIAAIAAVLLLRRMLRRRVSVAAGTAAETEDG